ncbi:MAG TPA: hypothetical protein VF468_29635 [Actinomycetota bacterium]|nr:hypothetical protein [Actinomycetota bacterium]
MAGIRVHCRHCPTTTILWPDQLLLVPNRGTGTCLFFCPTCRRITDHPAGPDQLLLLTAAGVPHDGDRHRVPGGRS